MFWFYYIPVSEELALTALMGRLRPFETDLHPSLVLNFRPASATDLYPFGPHFSSLRESLPSKCFQIRNPTYSLMPISTFKLCAVKRAHCGRVYHVLVTQINVLPQEVSTGLSLFYLKTGYDGSLDPHTLEHLCQWKWE